NIQERMSASLPAVERMPPSTRSAVDQCTRPLQLLLETQAIRRSHKRAPTSLGDIGQNFGCYPAPVNVQRTRCDRLQRVDQFHQQRRIAFRTEAYLVKGQRQQAAKGGSGCDDP